MFMKILIFSLKISNSSLSLILKNWNEKHYFFFLSLCVWSKKMWNDENSGIWCTQHYMMPGDHPNTPSTMTYLYAQIFPFLSVITQNLSLSLTFLKKNLHTHHTSSSFSPTHTFSTHTSFSPKWRNFVKFNQKWCWERWRRRATERFHVPLRKLIEFEKNSGYVLWTSPLTLKRK